MTERREELARDMEVKFGLTRGEGTLTRLDVNNSPYITLSIGGLKEEGKPVPGLADSEEQALEGFSGALRDYLAQHHGQTVIHWRRQPDTEFDPETGKWLMTARLSLSAPATQRHSLPKAAGQVILSASHFP